MFFDFFPVGRLKDVSPDLSVLICSSDIRNKRFPFLWDRLLWRGWQDRYFPGDTAEYVDLTPTDISLAFLLNGHTDCWKFNGRIQAFFEKAFEKRKNKCIVSTLNTDVFSPLY